MLVKNCRRNRACVTRAAIVSFAVLAGISPRAWAQSSAIGAFEGHGDVGKVSRAGSVSYDSRRDEYVIAGSGQNMWGDHDDFHIAWKRLSGNFILTARTHFLGAGVDPHRKLGWIVRSTLETGSPHVAAAVHGSGLVSVQFRRATGATTEEKRSPIEAADMVQLERRGLTYFMSTAKYGDTLRTDSISQIALGDTVYVGLFVCAHNDTVTERATFRDVRITIPARGDFVAYREYLGSNVETVDVASGDRRIVQRSPVSIQAPNWTHDGRALIYNREGLLYRFDLASGQETRINTDFATRNNNDHVLSFDGKQLGISHGAVEDSGRSNIYVLPVRGGTPRRVTQRGPSYLHGWSLDGRYLVYTGVRDQRLDIYRIPVAGGNEVQLTKDAGMNDGSEYSPDGHYIYFNSTRSGLMQLWRMRPDGSEQQQLTNDAFNNWFPHLSPDGRWIAFLSFMRDVRPEEHPWYKPVYLRLMPASGGATRVLAYVYGGQGTINVPSWSPDGKCLAFVSNTVQR